MFPQWVYRPSTIVVPPLQHLHVPFNRATYCLRSPKKPSQHCLPFAVPHKAFPTLPTICGPPKTLPNIAYHLWSPKIPSQHCLPFVTIAPSHGYCLLSIVNPSILQTLTFKYFPFLLPHIGCYLHVATSDFQF